MRRAAGFLPAIAMLALVSCVAPPPIPDGVDYVQKIRVVAWEWGYDPTVATVYAGYPIRLKLESLDREHTFSCDELEVDVRVPPRKDGSVEWEFTVDKPGTYTFVSRANSGPGVSRQQFRLYVKEAPRR